MMSFLYRKGGAIVRICKNREVLHKEKTIMANLNDWPRVEGENELRRELCPHTVELSTQEEESDVYFTFIEQETTGLWYRTGGIIFHFKYKEDAMAFKLRF